MRALRRIVIVAAFGFLVGGMGLFSKSAKADLLYEQTPQFPNAYNAFTSTYDPTILGNVYRTFDNFSLASTATITDLTWQGFSFDASVLGPTNIPVSAFNIGFYSDSAGEPGALLFSETIGFSQSAAGTTDFFGSGLETVYDYSGTLSSGFTATAGTNYWFSVQGVTDYPAFWTWTSGDGGDGVTIQDLDPAFGGSRMVKDGDRAFSLSSRSVPEPSTLLLTCIGAGGLLLGARRRRSVNRV